MIRKNEEYVVEIIDNGFMGEGIARIDGQVIFIPNCIKGEIVKIKILKVTKSECYAKLLEIHKRSEFRKKDDCIAYEKCGGCNLRHIDYEKSLEMKKNAVKTTIKKSLKRDIEIEEVIRNGKSEIL